jgi:hypothetical protein
MYISKSNLNKIINSVQSDSNYLDSLYHADLQFCLSNAETQFLTKAKTFFLSKDRLQLMFKKVEVTDNLIFIFESSAPAYHLNDKCQRLHSNWFNYYLPMQIKSKGIEEIKRFRNFIRESVKKDKLELGSPALTLAIKAEFAISDIHFGRVEKNNSGVSIFSKELEDANLTYINHALEKVYSDLLAFKDISDIHQKIYGMRYFDPSKIKRLTKFSSQEEKDIAEQFAELKAKLIIALIEAYKKTNDFDHNEVEEGILMTLGFHKCSHCFA